MENNTESWAIYTQGDYAITDWAMVTVGLRYTDEDKDIKYSDNAPCLITNPFCGFADTNMDGIADTDLTTANIRTFAGPTDQSTEVLTPRVAVNFTPTDDHTIFVSFTKGFKSGGWNARGTTSGEILSFSQEKVWQFETGAKTEWLDNRLRVNLTGFYYDVEDFQLPTGFASATGGIVFITQNFADLETFGLELEVLASPIDNLTLFTSVGWQDSEYQSLDASIIQQQADCLAGINVGDNCGNGIITATGGIGEPVRTPDYTVTAGADYVIPIGGSLELIPSAYLYSVGDHWVGSNNSTLDKSDGYTTYNASLTLANTEDDWQIVAECKNCNDRTMKVSTLAGVPYFQDPRTWLVRFKKGFGGS